MSVTASSKNIWLIIIGGAIGNLTEWYNFLLYGYLASVISQLFFPVANKLLSLTLVFTVFALGFLMRPLGGILFGWIGDTYGRQQALIISLLFMIIPTFLISCLPTYQTIGIASPIMLCILRMFQGLSAGGEHTGSAVYMLEQAPLHRRALWISAIPASAALGILISSAAALLIINSFTPSSLLTWGWRTGYWVGTLLCVISLYLRIKMPETPSFQQKQTSTLCTRSPIILLLNNKDALKKLTIIFFLAASWGIFYQILFIWMPTYLSQVLHIAHRTSLQINTLYLLLFAVLILVMGYGADYIKRKWSIAVACIAMIVFALPLFKLLSSGSLNQILPAMGILTVIFSIFLPATFVSMAELFPTEMRYTGLSFGFNLGLAIFGGTTPLVATWLIQLTGNNLAPAFYMMLAAIIALVTCCFLPSQQANTF